MIPAGRYIARPVSVGLVDPKGDGRQQVLIEFEIKDGRIVDYYGSINEQERNGVSALQITVEALRALGWEGKNIGAIDFPKDAEGLITIAHETWGGRLRDKVVNIARPALDRFAVPQENAIEIGKRLESIVSGIGERSQRGSNGRRGFNGGGGFDDANYDDQEHAD
jgi:hypothetical protein